MIRAYQEIYLSKAQAVLGETFDYAVNSCGIPGEDFIKLFLASSISKHMEKGEPLVLAGKSGIEIVQEIVVETKGKELQCDPQDHFGRSREYWVGGTVAYYRWYSDRKFSDVFKVLSFNDLQQMYYTLHEADISKVVDIVDACMKDRFPETNLQTYPFQIWVYPD